MSKRTATAREGASGGRCADVLGVSFQKALQQHGQDACRTCLQGALTPKEQTADRSHPEALLLKKQRAMTPLRETVAQMDVELLAKRNAIRALEQQVDEIKESGADHSTEALDELLQRHRVELRIVDVKLRAQLQCSSQLGESLHTATVEGQLAEVRSLLQDGAKVDYIDRNGFTALMCALGSALRLDVISLLVERGADIHAVSIHGTSMIHLAAMNDDKGWYVKWLVAAGLDVNARNEDGVTPLHFAGILENEGTVHALLSAGARKDLKAWGGSWKNRTPFDIARTPEMRYLLRL